MYDYTEAHMTNLLLTTEVHKSGGRLLIRMLNVHSQISMAAQDGNPYRTLFRALRNAIVPEVDPGSRFDTYFCDPDKLVHMNRIQNVDLSRLEFRAESNREGMHNLVRAEDGEGMKTLFDRVIPQGPNTYYGFNQNDCVEFIPTLARAYPEAKFFILTRDPRAVVNSGFSVRQESFTGLRLLEVIRQWRKMVAFNIHLRQTMSNQLCFLSYESLVNESELSMRKVCKFLDLEYEPDMIDGSHFTDPDGWDGLGMQGDIYKSRIDGWKDTLPVNVAAFVEFLCGPEMRALGYDTPGREPDWDHIVQFFSHDHQGLANEALRRTLASSDVGDEKLLREYFLFPEVKTYLKEA